MGYQALLFCLDEKLARVVTQVFSELDFKFGADALFDNVRERGLAVSGLPDYGGDGIQVEQSGIGGRHDNQFVAELPGGDRTAARNVAVAH